MFDQLKIHNGVTEQLKAADQMKWVRRMNAVRYEAAEIVAKLIQQGRYTDAVDELLIKLQKARRCRHG